MDTQQRFVAHGLVERDGRYLLLRCPEETGLRTEVVGELTRYENPDTEGRDIVFHTVTFELRVIDDARRSR